MKKTLYNTLFALFLLPFLLLIVWSFAENWRYPQLVPQQFTTAHWAMFFHNNQGSISLSFLLSTSIALSVTTLGFFISKTIKKHEKSNYLLQLAYFPYSFSPVVYAFCTYFLFLKSGLCGTFLGVWIAQFMLAFPFVILLFSSHWTTDLYDMEALVRTLGGSTWQAMIKVILPMSKNVLLLAFFQTFLISWFDYGIVLVIGMGKINTLIISNYQYINEANVYLAAIASLITLLPPLFFLWLNKRLLLY